MDGNNDAQQFMGRTVYSSDGDKIGPVGQVYLDDQTGQPNFVTVNTGLFGTNESFVPVSDAQTSSDRITVPYTKDKVKGAPNVSSDGHISEAEEQEIYTYYGLSGSGHQADAGYADTTSGVQPVGHDTSGPTTDEAMTRSEERLEVGTQQQEAGRARLRKWVETETQTTSVPVTKERAVVEREPITDANVGQATSGPEISEEEHEVVLHEERAVVDKTVEPVERVRLDKETVTEQESVSGDVRKEQIEVEGDTDRR